MGIVCTSALASEPGLQLVAITSGTPPHVPINRETLRNIYLKKIFIDSDGQRLIPVNLPPASALRSTFASDVLNMPESRLADYWNRQYFQGVSPPYVLASQQAVVRFVATTPGAIGYVASCHLDASVHVAMVIARPIEPSSAECGTSASP